MPTQYDEDISILNHFGDRIGRFLDVGAGDGITFSNTVPLLRNGWSGVMVEPSLGQLRWLLENHGDNPRVEIVPGGVTEGFIGWREFFDARDFSTLDATHRALVESHSQGEIKFRRRMAPLMTWEALLSWHPGPYQFLNIDTERTNLAVLRSCPLEHFEMVCIELDPAEDPPEVKRILANAGMVKQEIIGGNLVACR